jgi:hypothetical protein
MLSGELDGATPPHLWAAAAKSLPNGRQILLRKTAHAYTSDCAASLIDEFIDRRTAQALDISCAEKMRRPPFARELPARYTR